MTVKQTAERPEQARGRASRVDLCAALTATMPHASTDWEVPILNAVHVNAERGVLTLTACDRYSVGRYCCQYEGDPWTAVLSLPDCKQLAKACKPTRAQESAPVTFIVEDGRVTTAIETVTFAFTPVVGEFPNVEKVWPDHGAPVPLGGIALDPLFLARFAAAATRLHEPMHVSLHGPGKPITVTIGDRFTGLLMPIRVT